MKQNKLKTNKISSIYKNLIRKKLGFYEEIISKNKSLNKGVEKNGMQ